MRENTVFPSRIPHEINGIQINFCKNPACGNYNNPASTLKQPRGPNSKDRERNSYTLSGRSHDLFLNCSKCKKCPPVKSNKGIQEEIDRISAYLEIGSNKAKCQNPLCVNHELDLDVIDYPECYRPYGKTRIGSPRFRCKGCGKTFSVPQKSTHRQRKSHVNAIIFKELVGKKFSKGLAGIADVSMKTLYDKIDFIYRQQEACPLGNSWSILNKRSPTLVCTFTRAF